MRSPVTESGNSAAKPSSGRTASVPAGTSTCSPSAARSDDEGGGRGPRLRAARRRIRDRAAGARRPPAEQLREPPVERRRRVEQPDREAPGDVAVTGPRQPVDGDRRVVRPHAAGVVAERVVPRVVVGHRAQAVSAVEARGADLRGDRGDLVVVEDPGRREVADVRRQRVDGPPGPVEGDCGESPAASVDPEPLLGTRPAIRAANARADSPPGRSNASSSRAASRAAR